MIEKLKKRLAELEQQREMLRANLNGMNGAIGVLLELIQQEEAPPSVAKTENSNTPAPRV